MKTELLLTKLTPEATKGLLDVGPVKRAAYFRSVVEGMGGTVLSYFIASGGEWDLVAIVEYPDDHRGNPAGFLIGQATGAWVKSINVPLYRPEEIQAALATATSLSRPGDEPVSG